MALSRRQLIATAAAGMALPQTALATRRAKNIAWDDLIPPGAPYSEIIGEGEMDERNDIWRPIFDQHARKLNPALDGAYVRMPGFIIPMDISTRGVTSFILVPYVGACIHTPPPPPNQLVYVTLRKPWPNQDLWQAVWVTGQMSHEIEVYDVAETGYAMRGDLMELYEW